MDRPVWLDNYSVAEPGKRGKGGDLVLIDSIKVSDDKKSITLNLPDMGPVHQMKLKYRLKRPRQGTQQRSLPYIYRVPTLASPALTNGLTQRRKDTEKKMEEGASLQALSGRALIKHTVGSSEQLLGPRR
jgi:hypothetical protein